MASAPPLWIVVYYQDSLGNRPAQEFIASLSVSARAAVFHDINLLRELKIAAKRLHDALNEEP